MDSLHAAPEPGSLAPAATHRRLRLLDVAVLLLAIAILAAHAGLVPVGHWEVDEFHNFGQFRDHGWTFFWQRLIGWSPRPISESLIGLYFLVIERVRQPLLAPFLALFWLAIGAATAGFALRGPRTWPRLLLVAVTLCMFLLGHRISEVFYWPLGAAAYATTLAGLTLIATQFLDGRWRPGHGQALCVLITLIVAGSAEVGAIFALVLSTAMLFLGLIGVLGPRRSAWPWLLPILLALGLFALLLGGRGQLEEHVTYLGHTWSPKILGHPVRALFRTIPTFARQVAGLDAMASGPAQLAWGIAVKFVFFLGAFACLGRIMPDRRIASDRLAISALLLACVATVFLSITAAYYKFGAPCCERHDTLRQCLVILAELAAAALLAGTTRLRLPPAAGPVLLAAVLIALSALRWTPLREAYLARPTLLRVERANWASGTAPGDAMTMYLSPMDPLIQGFAPPERTTYTLDGNPPWMWQLVMEYFHKRSVDVRPTPSL